MKKIFLWLFLCGVTMLFGQGKLHFTTTNASLLNLYKFNPDLPPPYAWPGIALANPSVKFDDASSGGGFYSDEINPQKEFILNNINNGSGGQTGNISISQDTWGQYNGSNIFNALMTTSTMTTAGIIKFASGGYSGGWGNLINTTYDATNQVYTLTTNYTSGSGFDIYINGTKFLYRTTAQVTGYNASYSNASVTVTFNPYTGAMTMAPGPSVSANAITPAQLCAGASLNVPYTATGTFGAGNTFTAQLSNASGSFAAPTTIGSLTSTVSGTISTTIPAGTVYGAGYRIRVVSSNPAVDGSDNGTDLTINPVISSAILHYPKTETICDNAPFTAYGRIGIAGITNNDGTSFSGLTAQFGYGTSNNPATWTWSPANYGAQGASVDNTKDEYSFTIPANTLSSGTIYYYGFKFKLGDCTEVLAGQNGIFNNDPGVLTVLQGTKITTQPTASQTVNLYTYTTLSITASANASGPLSYQWYRNTTNSNIGGTAISGETNSSYVVNTYTSGTFYYYLIASTGGGSCDSTASNVSTVIVNDATTSGTANWANIQSPKMELDSYLGAGIDIYAQIFIPNSTPGTGTDPDIKAWIGYSTTNTNPNTWAESQWIAAEPNPLQSQLVDNNDEYMKQGFGTDLPFGTYYIASRFQKGTGAYVYGGTEDTTDNVSGGIWGIGPYKSLKININGIITWIPNSGNTTGEWNNGVGPVITSPVIIATDISSPPSFSTKELTINNGVTFTIPLGSTVIVQDQIINLNGNDSPETFVVQSDANLIQVNPVANASKIKVERSVTDLNNVIGTNIDYVYWSSPVADQNLQAFSPGTVRNRIYEYRESNDYFYEAPENNFTGGKGYAIRAETSGVASGTYSKTYSFVGIPNNGAVDYPIKRSPNTGTGGTVVHGYNLVGNPYPSNIDFDVLYQNNADKIYNTAWFWQTNTVLLTQTGNGYVGNNYVIYNGTGGNPGTNNLALTAPNGIIKVGQGFLVQKKDLGNAQLNFKNSYAAGQNLRVANTGTFYQKGNSKPAKNRFWLKLVSPENVSNTQLIGYINGATNGYEKDFDAEAFSLSSDLFYSVLGDKRLVIQGKAGQFSQQDRVALGTNFFSKGNYTITLENPEGLFANEQSIYLKDKHTGIITNLSQGSYTFNTNAGETNARFEILYQPEAVLATDATAKEQLVVYREHGDLVVRSPKQMERIDLYEASGKLLRTLKTNTKSLTLETSSLISGMYLLRVQMTDGSIVTKKVIR